MILALVGLAHADDTLPDSGMDAQQFRLPVDARYTMWADDASLHKGFLAKVGVGWVHNPVMFEYADTGERVAIVGDAVGLNLVPAFTFWQLRAGLDVPLYVAASGESGSGGGIGDIAADLKLVALDPATKPLGLALDVRMRFPTATTAIPLGVDGVSWEAAAVADKRLGPLALAANIGVQGVPKIDLDDQNLSVNVLLRGALGYVVSEKGGLSLDVATALATKADDTTPGEVMLGGWFAPSAPIALRLGLGRGITGGAGSPAVRAVAALSWEPGAGKTPQKIAPDTRVGTTQPTPRTGPVKTEPVKTEPVKTEPAKTEPPTTPTKVEPSPTTVTPVMPPPPQVEITLKERPLVELTQQKLVLTKKITFTDTTITADSLPVLNAVADMLVAHPEIAGVRVESHTDNRLGEEPALEMSGMRASAVLDYLVARGVAADRLIAAGYGGGRPIVQGDTPEVWAMNDRIEFFITSRTP